MRIITGKFKGRTLNTVPDKSVRPVTDRVKGTIFNVLQNRIALDGADVADVFAGSGSLGFEALSRGANRVLFVDDQSRALDMIERNATTIGCLDDCELMQIDGMTFLDRSTESFDIIFADPPYAYEETRLIPAKVFGKQLLKKKGFLIIEHPKNVLFDAAEEFDIAVQKQFGTTRISFFTETDRI